MSQFYQESSERRDCPVVLWWEGKKFVYILKTKACDQNDSLCGHSNSHSFIELNYVSLTPLLTHFCRKCLLSRKFIPCWKLIKKSPYICNC